MCQLARDVAEEPDHMDVAAMMAKDVAAELSETVSNSAVLLMIKSVLTVITSIS